MTGVFFSFLMCESVLQVLWFPPTVQKHGCIWVETWNSFWVCVWANDPRVPWRTCEKLLRVRNVYLCKVCRICDACRVEQVDFSCCPLAFCAPLFMVSNNLNNEFGVFNCDAAPGGQLGKLWMWSNVWIRTPKEMNWFCLMSSALSERQQSVFVVLRPPQGSWLMGDRILYSLRDDGHTEDTHSPPHLKH